LLVLALIPIFCALVWWCTRAIRRREQALHDSREQLRQAQQQLAAHASSLEATVAERTAKLQESINELQTLSYSIAHDMRAPLRAMGTFSQLLSEEVSTLSPLARDYCQRIMTGAERLDHLIRDALHYTRAALQDTPLQPVDLARLIPDLLQSYPNLQKENADISIEGPLPVVLGNSAFLTQCFSNLLGNAVKFVARGTRPKIRIGAETSNGLARIWIEDNGTGIPPGSEEQIFGMFHKLNPASEGTGIGLAIVQKVVERMQGKVGVESEPNRGSRFWVELKLPANIHE
jgi:signal transduction histidine kinase